MELQSWSQQKIEAEQNLAKLETRKTELQQQLLSSPSDAHRDRLESELAEIKKEITETISIIQTYEAIISKQRDVTDREKANRKIESKRLFDEAMKDGHALLHTNTLVLMGVAGSGKTSVKDLLLDNLPRKERNSTPVKDRILHVRPVTSQTVQSIGNNKWKEVSQDDMVDLLAVAIQRLPQKLRDSLPSVPPKKRPKLSDSDDKNSDEIENSSSMATTTVQKAISAVVDHVVDAILATSDSSSLSDTGKELFDANTIRITDNGGQPQFHDIASLFIRHASVGLFVMRLTDDFHDYPFDDLYESGKLVGTPSPSHLSHGETIMSLLRSFLSHSHHEFHPKCIFIGTFLDMVKDPKLVHKQNSVLIEVLPAELKKNLVYSDRGMNRLIFALNACSRDHTTQKVAQAIRNKIESSHSFDIKVPLWWFIIELSLQKLSSLLGRGVLKKNECIELAQHLGFQPDALQAALVYFDEMCIAHYYPEILPDIVFVDPQVPLDKVSELTQHAIKLRKESNSLDGSADYIPMDAKWKRFRDEGILTIDMLKDDCFKKHFEEDIFTPADLVAIMMKLLILAPLTALPPIEIKSSLPQIEFFMPSLLRCVPPSELEKHRVFSSSADPLLIRFRSGCIRCGVFCCLVVYLIKTCGWQVCLPSGEPILLARNCVKFRLPNHSASVTLIDSFSCIEVHIKARPQVCQRVCPEVRRSIMEGVNNASDALHYNNDKPLVSFFCPHDGSPENTQSKLHFAEIFEDSNLWRCSVDVDLDGDLELKHTIWKDKVEATDSQSLTRALQSSRSVEEALCIQFGLTGADINKEVSDGDILEVYPLLEKWEEVANHLGLTRADIKVIEGEAMREVELKRLYTLQNWKRKSKATETAATYRVLIRALLKCECSSAAILLCKLITKVVEQK